ncbi:MAG: DMT family transporter [Eubacteriales bacterium]|jgi:drug/metabolite transporter (DMT)-like permease
MKNKKQSAEVSTLIHALILLTAAVIWGFAFVSQSIGADYVGPFTFLAGRCWIAVAFLIPVVAIADRVRERRQDAAVSAVSTGRPVTAAQRRMLLTAGVVCGIFLFAASAAQQIGIGMTTTAKAGFITALYVILVPIVSLFLGHRSSPKIWVSVALGVTGLYFLCMKGGLTGLNRGDLILMLCALLYAFQILVVNHYLPMVDGLRLSLIQTLIEGILSTVFMLMLETNTAAALKAALPAILFAGIMSSGVAYTFQIIGQKGLKPAVASLLMCLESVFAAIGGWLFQGQVLTGRELLGCILMFSGTVLSLLPARRRA